VDDEVEVEDEEGDEEEEDELMEDELEEDEVEEDEVVTGAEDDDEDVVLEELTVVGVLVE